jgi:hypothetical protein
VSDKKIHKDFLQGGELPANILPTSVAWKDMQQRLDKVQPDKSGLLVNDPGKDKAFRGRIVKGTALLLFLLFTWMALQQTNTKKNRKDIAQTASGKTHDSPKKDNNSISANDITNNADIEKEKGSEGEINTSGPSGNLSKNETDVSSTTNNKNKKAATSNTSSGKKVSSERNSKKNNPVVKKTKQKPAAKIQSNAGEIKIEQGNPLSKTLLNTNETLSSIQKDSINRSLSPVNVNSADKKKTDSLQKSNVANTEPEPQEKKHKEIEWGLHWTLQLPTGSAGQYFSGPSAAQQPYRILLPGLWLNFRMGRSVFQTEVNPFASAVLPAKSFGTFSTSYTNVDTIVTTTQVKTLRKMFGISGTIGYAYNISGNWWLGTSIQGYWWRKGIASTKGEEVKQVIGSSSQTKKRFNTTYSMGVTEKDYFAKVQMVNSLELAYKMKAAQAMLRIGISPLPFSKKEGPGNPFRAEFLFKLQLFKKKNASSGFVQ